MAKILVLVKEDMSSSLFRQKLIKKVENDRIQNIEIDFVVPSIFEINQNYDLAVIVPTLKEYKHFYRLIEENGIEYITMSTVDYAMMNFDSILEHKVILSLLNSKLHQGV